jgi:hypothetical protein
MLYRIKFVTNSSSTSFIAFGVILPASTLIEVNPATEYEEIADKINTLLKDYPGLRYHIPNFEDFDIDIMVFTHDSYISASDYGVTEVTQEKLQEPDQTLLKQWLADKKLKIKPSWLFASHVDY